jgi:hypothetical protein
MTALKKVLFSSTLGFNPGDEVILMGIERLLAQKGFKYEKAIYNRNPAAAEQRSATVNSDQDVPDYVIFSGTPEWSTEIPGISDVLSGPVAERLAPRFLARVLGLRQTDRINDPLLRYVLKNRIPCSFIGVGSSKRPTATHKISRILSELKDVFVVRDEQTGEVFDVFNPAIEPCPAFFCAEDPAPRSKISRVGFTVQAPHSNLIRVSNDGIQTMLSAVREVQDHTGLVEVICHHSLDYEFARKQFPDLTVHLVGSGSEMIDVYRQFDVIFSSRLHGCAAACSLGIPTYQLWHGLRMNTLELFPVVNKDARLSPVGWLNDLDVEAASIAVLESKKRARRRYMLLLDALPFLDSNGEG